MENCSQTQPGKVSYDPGWNDPPKFSYNAQKTTPNRPRNFLNKRVAFPLESSGANLTSAPPVNLPPLPTKLPAPPVQVTKSVHPEEIEIDSTNALNEVKTILLSFLDNSNEMGPKVNDIRRRINIMEEMWTSEKLNKKIHFQMKELVYALRDNEPQKADDIHRALMVDHVSSVGVWMPGVKQLIHHCIARSELLAIDED